MAMLATTLAPIASCTVAIKNFVCLLKILGFGDNIFKWLWLLQLGMKTNKNDKENLLTIFASTVEHMKQDQDI